MLHINKENEKLLRCLKGNLNMGMSAEVNALLQEGKGGGRERDKWSAEAFHLLPFHFSVSIMKQIHTNNYIDAMKTGHISYS